MEEGNHMKGFALKNCRPVFCLNQNNKMLTKTTLKLTLISVLTLSAGLACQQKSNFQGRQHQWYNTDLTPAIVNGEPVLATDPVANSTVALYLDLPQAPNQKENLIGICTGTLITKDIVLTAAHCFVDAGKEIEMNTEELRQRTRIAFGLPVFNNENSKDSQAVQFRLAKSVIIHSKYYVGAVYKAEKEAMYDMALIQLDSAAPAGYEPVQVNADKDLLKKGTEVILAGYGVTKGGIFPIRPKQLMKVNVHIDNPQLTQTQFTYKTEQGKSSCNGDSGGPAYVQTETGLLLVGVTSWGDRYCTQMGAYTSTAALQDWLQNSMGQFLH